MGIAERYNVVVDFSKYSVGSQVYLHNVTQGVDFSGDISPNAIIYPFMRFDIVRSASDNSSIPMKFRSLVLLPVTKDTLTQTFTFSRDRNCKWTINGKT